MVSHRMERMMVAEAFGLDRELVASSSRLQLSDYRRRVRTRDRCSGYHILVFHEIHEHRLINIENDLRWLVIKQQWGVTILTAFVLIHIGVLDVNETHSSANHVRADRVGGQWARLVSARETRETRDQYNDRKQDRGSLYETSSMICSISPMPLQPERHSHSVESLQKFSCCTSTEEMGWWWWTVVCNETEPKDAERIPKIRLSIKRC